MKRIERNLLLLPALIISICLSYSCKKPSGELEGYEDYPLVQYMREHGWVGMGDSTFCYPQDSVLYNGLKVDGKSLQEVELLYGEPRYCVNYTIRYGIPQRFLETNPLFPLTYQRAEVPILYAEWVITNKVNLIIFLKTMIIRLKPYMEYNSGLIIKCLVKYLVIISLSGLFNSCNDKEKSISMEEYKEKYAWIDTVYSPYVICPYDRLGIKNMDYEEVINRNGIPVLEYNDTIVRGINIQRGKEDFDLYPMTLNRDTVIVRRCWWLKAIRKADLLYVVFELKDSIPTSYPIYGYRYNPGKMPKVNDNFVRRVESEKRLRKK